MECRWVPTRVLRSLDCTVCDADGLIRPPRIHQWLDLFRCGSTTSASSGGAHSHAVAGPLPEATTRLQAFLRGPEANVALLPWDLLHERWQGDRPTLAEICQLLPPAEFPLLHALAEERMTAVPGCGSEVYLRHLQYRTLVRVVFNRVAATAGLDASWGCPTRSLFSTP